MHACNAWGMCTAQRGNLKGQKSSYLFIAVAHADLEVVPQAHGFNSGHLSHGKDGAAAVEVLAQLPAMHAQRFGPDFE